MKNPKEPPGAASDAASDEILMARCARGDQAAFQALYERHHRMVYNLAFRLLGNHADAEEVLPDVFVKVWQKAGEFRGQSRVSTWLYRVASNMAMDRLRSARVGKEVFYEDLSLAEKEMPDRGASAETPEESVLRQEDQRALASALGRLGPEDRLLVTLYHLQGCSYAEIEEITGVTPVNIKSKLFRARRRLREILKPTLKGDAPDGVPGDTASVDGLRAAAADGR
jgi:RNA polymerase sigma-70 factor (ECF subfamily)